MLASPSLAKLPVGILSQLKRILKVTLKRFFPKGKSMEPTIHDGSIVTIREQPTVEDGEIAAALVDGDNEATLKRVKH